ncbi:MAG: hypothetical protein ACK4E0_03670 [Chitinophagaceae bacterium]
MAVPFFVPDLSDIKNRNLELEKEKNGNGENLRNCRIAVFPISTFAHFHICTPACLPAGGKPAGRFAHLHICTFSLLWIGFGSRWA